MPTGHKIALFGIGGIGRLIYSGTAALTFCEAKKEKSDFNIGILKIAAPVDNRALLKEYKKVQHKYYPERDVLIKTNKDKKIF